MKIIIYSFLIYLQVCKTKLINRRRAIDFRNRKQFGFIANVTILVMIDLFKNE